jgi:hypothetical protein
MWRRRIVQTLPLEPEYRQAPIDSGNVFPADASERDEANDDRNAPKSSLPGLWT